MLEWNEKREDSGLERDQRAEESKDLPYSLFPANRAENLQVKSPVAGQRIPQAPEVLGNGDHPKMLQKAGQTTGEGCEDTARHSPMTCVNPSPLV